MSAQSSAELTGPQKAAVLLLVLGARQGRELVSRCRLGQPEVETLLSELARIDEADESTQQSVLQEFSRLASSSGVAMGGPELAAAIATDVLGPERAAELLRHLRARPPEKPLNALAAIDSSQLVDVLREEQPQAIAIVLQQIPRRKAGEILSGLPDDIRMAVVMALVKTGNPSREGLHRLASALRRRATLRGARQEARDDVAKGPTDGARTLVEILNEADLGVETAVLESLGESDPELGERVRASMFIFEDLPDLEPRALQLAVREVESSDLALALKGASEELKSAVINNLSENAAAGLKEDLESLGPTPRRDVYAARQKLVMAARALAEEGKINLRKQKEGDAEGEEAMIE
jgi:flagellar motor switch protein FliG